MTTAIDNVIAAAERLNIVHDTMEAIDAIRKDYGEVTDERANRLLEAIESGLKPRHYISSLRGETGLYGHPVGDDGLVDVPITGSGTYDPRTEGEKKAAKKFLPFNHPDAGK